MQRKDLALRVLSTAAIMSIVTSIAAPAFADIYYIGNGSIDVEAITDADGEQQYVKVTQGNKTYTDTSNEIVIKDGTSEANATLKEANRVAATPAADPAATPATQELEAAGPAAGESQSDPDAGFTQNETGEDSAQTQEGNNPTEDTPDPSTENLTEDTPKPPKRDEMYQYDPAADPEQEQPATKLAPTSADPAAETREAALAPAPAADPAPTTPAEGSAANPSKNVIKVVNNWVGEAAKELKIRLSNVNIKATHNALDPQGPKSAMTVSGSGATKIELDGKNTLDSFQVHSKAGLNKQGTGTMTITDETDDEGKKITAPKLESDTSGSLTAKGGHGNGGAGIGGGIGDSIENIIIEGYATVDATGFGGGAGIGGGASYNEGTGGAKNITIQGHSNVRARAEGGAAIGSGSGTNDASATGIVIRDHAVVDAQSTEGTAIGCASCNENNTEADVTIGTDGKTEAEENVRVTAIGGKVAIGNGVKDTKVTIQGHVSIWTANANGSLAIGSYKGNVEVNIKDNVAIDNEDTVTDHSLYYVGSSIGGGSIASNSGRTVKVTIDGGENGNVRLGENSAITGEKGAVSGTEVKIGNNVLLKMRKKGQSSYIAVNGAEADAGGLVNTIGDNTELWYIDPNNRLQKIVHGKNVCKKEPGDLKEHQDATCGKDGYNKYQCGYEHAHHAEKPSCDLTWQEVLKATGNHLHTEIRGKKDATCTEKGYTGDTWCTDCNQKIADGKETPVLGHNFHGTENVTKAATCTTEGIKLVKCTRCDAVDTQTIPKDPDAHDWGEWQVTTHATCTTPGVETRYCHNNNSHFETRPTAKDSNNHTGHGTHIEGYVAPTCTKDGYTGDTYCNGCNQKIKDGTVIPATGHHWVDKGDGTHTCPDCGATEGQPVNTNSALELRVVDAEGMDQPFTVSQNGTLRTYTGAYDTATLTGDLDTLRYLQDHGAQTIQFVTNGQTSSFVINDLLAQGSGSEVFYLTHRGAEEPTLLLVEADHSELVKD